MTKVTNIQTRDGITYRVVRIWKIIFLKISHLKFILFYFRFLPVGPKSINYCIGEFGSSKAQVQVRHIALSCSAGHVPVVQEKPDIEKSEKCTPGWIISNHSHCFKDVDTPKCQGVTCTVTIEFFLSEHSRCPNSFHAQYDCVSGRQHSIGDSDVCQLVNFLIFFQNCFFFFWYRRNWFYQGKNTAHILLRGDQFHAIAENIPTCILTIVFTESEHATKNKLVNTAVITITVLVCVIIISVVVHIFRYLYFTIRQ